VNTDQLRQSVRDKWLTYYEENRHWLARLGVWVNCDGQRRPSSGFILATLSILEPQLSQLLPLIVDLSSNPDRIVVALGLNFNPDEQLEAIASGVIDRDGKVIADSSDNGFRMLPAAASSTSPPADPLVKPTARVDEACRGARHQRH